MRTGLASGFGYLGFVALASAALGCSPERSPAPLATTRLALDAGACPLVGAIEDGPVTVDMGNGVSIDWRSAQVGSVEGPEAWTGSARHEDEREFTLQVCGESDGIGNRDTGGAERDQMQFVYTDGASVPEASPDNLEIVIVVRDLLATPETQVGVAIREDSDGPGVHDEPPGRWATTVAAAFSVFTGNDNAYSRHEFHRVVRDHGESDPDDEALPDPFSFEKATTDHVPGANPMPCNQSGSCEPQEVLVAPPEDEATRIAVWLRLQRYGDDVAFARSLDGVTWVPLMYTSGGAFFPEDVHIGFLLSAGKRVAPPHAMATIEVDYVGPTRREYHSTWVAGTFGAESTSYVSKQMNSFYVDRQGRAYKYGANADGGSNVNIIENGVVLPHLHAMPTNAGQGAITGAGGRVYIAGFDYVKGFDQDLNPLSQSTESLDFGEGGLGRIGGIAAGCVPQAGGPGSECRLYVAEIDTGEIHVIDTASFTLTDSFQGVDRPGPMAVDAAGNVWVIQSAVNTACTAPCLPDDFNPLPGNFDATEEALVQCFTPEGDTCGTIPTKNTANPHGVLNPSAIAIDPRPDAGMPSDPGNRLLVAENGSDQNIRIYNLANLSGEPETFGFGGGIFAGTPGRVFDAAHGNHARFYAISGVGLDDSGNMYVASGLDVDIRKFAPKLGTNPSTTLEWETSQSAHVYGFGRYGSYVDFDPGTDGQDLFSVREHFTFDANQTGPGSEAGFKGVTWNPFALDERDNHNHTRRREGMPIVRRLGSGQNKKRFMFAGLVGADPNDSDKSVSGRTWLMIYRFDENDIAIPCGALRFQWLCEVNDCATNEQCACSTVPGGGTVGAFQHLSLWTDGRDHDDTDETNAFVDGIINEVSEVEGTYDLEDLGNDPAKLTYEGDNALMNVLHAAGGTPALPTHALNPPNRPISNFDVDTDGSLWLTFGANEIWELVCTNCDDLSGPSAFPKYSLEYKPACPSGGDVDCGGPGLSSNRRLYSAPPVFNSELAGHSPVTTDGIRYDAENQAMYLHRAFYPESALPYRFAVTRIANYRETGGQGSCSDPNSCFDAILPQMEFLPEWSDSENPAHPDFTRSLQTAARVPRGQSGDQYTDYTGFDVAHDKIFVSERRGSIHIFDLTSHAWLPERIMPGPEVSGLSYDYDHAMGIRVHYREDAGEYLIAKGEGSSVARTIVYRWKPGGDLGEPCMVDSQCESGFCRDGICCESDCTSDESCVMVQCVNIENDPGVCLGIELEDGTVCDDEDQCTFDDECASGVCVGTGGTACSSNGDCVNGQFCDGACAMACQPLPCSLNGTFGAISSVFDSSVTASGFTLSQDGLTAYISSKTSSNYDLYAATRNDVSEAFGPLDKLETASSTTADDRSPWLSPDGLSLYFWRRGSGDTNLYVSTWNSGLNDFGTASSLSVNSDVSDEDPYFSWNGQRLYFISDRPGGDTEFYTSEFNGTSFATPVKIPNLNSWTEEHHPVISRDELRIYIGSEKDGFEGDTNGDIWISQRSSTSVNFPAPTNPLALNSSGREDPVFLSADECTLYFMSNRDTGAGGTLIYRIYQTTRGASP